MGRTQGTWIPGTLVLKTRYMCTGCPGTIIFPNKHTGPSGPDKHYAVPIRKPPPPHIFPNKHPLVKIETEKTEILFPNKPKNPKMQKAPPPPRYRIPGRARVLIREYHSTLHFWGAVSLNNQTDRVLLLLLVLAPPWCGPLH